MCRRYCFVTHPVLSRVRSVADVNTALIDDGEVDKAKIGGSNYFWSFPAKKDRVMQLQHQERLETIETLKVHVQEATGKLADAKRGREDSGDDRATKLQRLDQIAKDTTAIQQELEILKENDPQALADLEKELKLCTEAANRWTDNIFNSKTYLVKKKGMDRKEVDRILGITSTFDCTCCVLLTACCLNATEPCSL
jgi:multidrug resistance efflux pump